MCEKIEKFDISEFISKYNQILIKYLDYFNYFKVKFRFRF